MALQQRRVYGRLIYRNLTVIILIIIKYLINVNFRVKTGNAPTNSEPSSLTGIDEEMIELAPGDESDEKIDKQVGTVISLPNWESAKNILSIINYRWINTFSKALPLCPLFV